ncbi:MAG: serine hydrolase [Flavobacteriales bacterium]|nr:serine hydrolase [Flavobacteriales bacterium]
MNQIKNTPIAVSLIVTLLLGIPAFAQTKLKLARPASVDMSAERLERLGQGMRRLIDDKKIPGAVTLIARRGKVVHFEAHGLRNVEAGSPMEKDTIFRLYSQSKLITGAAVMMLFEEGHFLLTDPVSKYLPEFADMQVYVGQEDGEIVTEPANPITIQHLLTHTSGLTYNFFVRTPVGKMYAENGITGGPTTRFANLKEWSEALSKMPLVAQPGTTWNYSVGMDVLGRLIEVVSGQTFRDFLKSRLFNPLGMVDTDFYVPADKLDRFASNYSPKPGGGLKLVDDPQHSRYRRLPALEMGGSGLVGTVGDYLRFAQMLENRGEYRGKRYLGSRTVEFMMSDHLTPEFSDDPKTSLLGVGVGFGLTGYVVNNPATSGLPVSVGTYGWGGAATTHVWVDLEAELVGLVHTQLMPDRTYPVRELMQSLTYQAIED